MFQVNIKENFLNNRARNWELRKKLNDSLLSELLETGGFLPWRQT